MTSRRLLAIMFGALIALVAACGSPPRNAQGHSAAAHRRPPPRRTAVKASGGGSGSAAGSGGIPQNGSGDHDSDKSGGPSDGDGNL